MRTPTLLLAVLLVSCPVRVSWGWPFGSSGGSGDPPRISDLMEPATLLIDNAADLAAEGKVDESVAEYRKALAELDRIELENPERAKSAEFSTLRNKRAYVNAAIDSMLLSQVQSNAKAVAVSDTRELEKKLAKEKRDRAVAAISKGDFETAETLVRELQKEKPTGAMALNLRATLEARRGNFKAAERALDLSIEFNPRSHFAYYNMALLLLKQDPAEKDIARRYYETGRTVGGPANPELEAALK